MNIIEFSKRLNLSTGTVSRALNNRPEVSAETRQRVLQKAQEFGFSPNANARRLVTGKNRLIRLECPHNTEVLSDQYLVEVARAVEHAAHARGYDLLLRLGSERRDTSQFQAVDGLVLLSAPKMTTGELTALTDAGRTPVVVIGAPQTQEIPGASYVAIDTLPGLREALALLAALGHRRVGCISSGVPGSEVRAALPGLMANAGLEWDQTLVVEAGVTVEAGCRAAIQLLRLPSPPTALFARTDVLAAGAIQGVHHLGLSVPQDVSVIGHDDTVVAALVTPPLTTVAIDIPRVGSVATEALLHMIDESAAPSIQTLPTRLKMRQSTGPRRQGDGLSSSIVSSSRKFTSSSA